jgi:hypothetical protein
MKLNQIGFWSEIKLEIIRRGKAGYDAADRSRSCCMKMFADENLFEPIIDYLKAIGNDMLSIRDSGLSGISDDEVYQRACTDKRVIIT